MINSQIGTDTGMIGANRILRISAGEISLFYFWSLDRSSEETHGSTKCDYDAMIAPENIYDIIVHGPIIVQCQIS